MATSKIVSTGILAFLLRIGSLFTGLAYVTLLTRRLSLDAGEAVSLFGYWSQIQSLLLYPSLISAPIGFWATRETARGGRASGTAFIGALITSSAAIALYLPAAVFLGGGRATQAFYLAAIILPFSFIAQALDAIALAREPRHSLYGLVAFEFGKVVATYLLIVSIPLSLMGAIFGMAAARAIQALVLTLKIGYIERPSLHDLGRWYRAGWLPFVLYMATLFSALDQAVIPVIYGSPQPTAFFNAALSAAAPVGYGAWLSFALYPMLLAGGGATEMRAASRLTMLLGVPMLVGAIVYAPSILGLLRPEYVAATWVLGLLAVVKFLTVVDMLLESVIMGVEKRDTVDGRIRGTLLHTNLVIRIGFTGAGFIASIIISIYATISRFDVIGLVTLWALAHLMTSLASTVVRLNVSRNQAHLPLSTLQPSRYLVASLVMVLFLLVVGQVGHAPFLVYLITLGFRVVSAAAVYFLTLALIDTSFRSLLLRTVKR